MMNYVIILLVSLLGCVKNPELYKNCKVLGDVIVNTDNEEQFIAALQSKSNDELNKIDERGRTVTHYASERGFVQALKYLKTRNITDHRMLLDNENKMPIALAAAGWYIEAMETLYEGYSEFYVIADIDTSFIKALIQNINLSRKYMCDPALKAKADELISDILADNIVTLKEQQLMTLASFFFYMGLSLGCQLKLDETKKRMLNLLLEDNFYPRVVASNGGYTPIHMGAVYVDHQLIAQCIRLGVGANIEYTSGNIKKRPIWLLAAAPQGEYVSVADQIESAQILINAGADINYNNNRRESVLLNAITSNNLELASFLLNNGGTLDNILSDQLTVAITTKIEEKVVGIEQLVETIVKRDDCTSGLKMKLVMAAIFKGNNTILQSVFRQLVPDLQKQLVPRLSELMSVDMWKGIEELMTIDTDLVMQTLATALSNDNRELSLYLSQHPKVDLQYRIKQIYNATPFIIGVAYFHEDRELLAHLLPNDISYKMDKVEMVGDDKERQETILSMMLKLDVDNEDDVQIAAKLLKSNTAPINTCSPLPYVLAFRSRAGILTLMPTFNWWYIPSMGNNVTLTWDTQKENSKIITYNMKKGASILDLVIARFGLGFVEDTISEWDVHPKTAKILVRHVGGLACLFDLLDRNQINIAKYLLKSGIRLHVNIKDKKRRASVLDLANDLGDDKLINLLTEAEAKTYQNMVDDKKESQAMKVVTTSLKKDSSSDEESDKELTIHDIVRNSDAAALTRFLNQADGVVSIIDSHDSYGDTPLYIAVIQKKSSLRNVLIANGASIDAVIDGHTVLYYAALLNNIPILKILVNDNRHSLLLPQDIVSLKKKGISDDALRLLQIVIEEEVGPSEPVVEEEVVTVVEAIVHRDIYDIYNELKDRVEIKLSRGKVGDDVKNIGGGLWQARVGLARFWYVRRDGRNYILHGIDEKRTQKATQDIERARAIKDNIDNEEFVQGD